MFSPPRELPESAPRLADGRYVLLGRLGRGGMAGVYAAWDTSVEEWRAIKVLLPKHARDGGLRARFEREGTTMMALHHPNLCRVFEVGDGEKLPFLVMELVNAGSLYRWTKVHGVMPPRMAVEATLQLCSGVAAVHDAGVVHRDIKPRNVLINWDGLLKLTDFGIAQLEDSNETRTGLAMGTLGFMSPEQLHDAKSVDLRTDIYALGATLWSQITARKARDLFRLEDKPGLMDGVPAQLRPILTQCLAYDPADRFQTALELADVLAGVLHDLPEDPPDAPPLPLPLESVSLKSRPDSTFSEILTTLSGESEGSPRSSEDDEPELPGPGSVPPWKGAAGRATLNPGLDRSATPSRATPSRPPQSLVAGLDAHRASRTGTPGVAPPRNAQSKNAQSKNAQSRNAQGRGQALSPEAPGLTRQGTANRQELPGQQGAANRQGSIPPEVKVRLRRFEEDDPDSLPEYLVGVEQPNGLRLPEVIRYVPEEKPAPPEARSVTLGRVLVALMLIPLLAGLLLVLGVTGTAGLGAWQVRRAADAVVQARGEFAGELTHSEAMLDELAAIGAERGPLRDAYERWRVTEDPGLRARAGLAFVLLAEQEAGPRIGFGQRNHEQQMVAQRLERLKVLREKVIQAEADWTGAAGTPQGWLAVAVRLAPPPGG